MKLTTKLLLGATVVVGLSLSAFAACATDVDFGGTKKITGLADGSADGDAVNVGQVLTKTTADVVETNSSKLASYNSTTYKIRVNKRGGVVCVTGLVRNVSSNSITEATEIGVIPSGFRHAGNPYIGVSTMPHSGSSITEVSPIGILIYPSGSMVLRASATRPLGIGQYMQVQGCYMQ